MNIQKPSHLLQNAVASIIIIGAIISLFAFLTNWHESLNIAKASDLCKEGKDLVVVDSVNRVQHTRIDSSLRKLNGRQQLVLMSLLLDKKKPAERAKVLKDVMQSNDGDKIINEVLDKQLEGK